MAQDKIRETDRIKYLAQDKLNQSLKAIASRDIVVYHHHFHFLLWHPPSFTRQSIVDPIPMVGPITLIHPNPMSTTSTVHRTYAFDAGL